MADTNSEPRLVHVLGTLESLLGPEDQPRIHELRDRLASGDLRVLLVGEAKRGKSTLANSLLGRPLMPTGVTPVTALPTLVQRGAPERLEVRFADGTARSLPLEDLGKYVTQQHNPENVKGVDWVRLVVERGLPHDRMVLVDSPGVGSVFAHNTEETETALASMDLALLVLTADAPMSESEAELLRRVAALSVEVLVILNKADLLAEDEVAEALAFVTTTATAVLGSAPLTLVCSGRNGTGVPDLERALRERLDESRLPALHRSVAAAARRLIARRTDEDAVALASIQALRDDRAAEVAAFADAIEETRRRGEEVRQLLRAGVARESGELYEQSRDQLERSARAVRAVLDKYLSHAPRDAGRAEEQGRAVIATAVRNEVESWRGDRATWVAGQLEDQQQRAQRALAESAWSLQQAAQRLLGVALSATVPVLPSQRRSDVTYDFDPAPDWNQALVTAARRLWPGARRRVAHYLRDLVRDLTDKHLGRARAALQTELEQRSRALSDAVSAAFEEQTSGLAQAHKRATGLRDRSAGTLDEEATRLARRIDALRGLRTQLESPATEEATSRP